MPIDYRDYDPNWQTIRGEILDRARNTCEFCGLANGAEVLRGVPAVEKYLLWDGAGYTLPSGKPIDPAAAAAEFDLTRPRTRIVLTVAHLDHDRRHNHKSNLRALCQACHLAHDNAQHAANRRRTLYEPPPAPVQLPLFEKD